MFKPTGPGKVEKRTNPASLMLYNFDTDGAAVKKEHEEFLRIEALPTLRRGGSVTLIGLTDRAGSPQHNQKLSEARIASTVDFLRREVPTGFNVRDDTAGHGEAAAERERERDGTANERFRTVLLFLSETPTPPEPPKPAEGEDPVRLARKAYGKWLQLKRVALIVPGTKEPTNLRLLNGAESREVWGLFGGSLNLTKIFISDGLGASGRPFTVALEAEGLGWIVVINLGSLASWDAPKRRAKDLMHELTHAWQSQHHSDKEKFMSSAVACQARAALSPPDFNAEAAYWYVPADRSTPPRPFASYGAEQIAQQVEDHYAGRQANRTIVAQVASTPANIVSADNVASLLVPRWEKSTTPGVVK
jgi:hypothetical protein